MDTFLLLIGKYMVIIVMHLNDNLKHGSVILKNMVNLITYMCINREMHNCEKNS